MIRKKYGIKLILISITLSLILTVEWFWIFLQQNIYDLPSKNEVKNVKVDNKIKAWQMMLHVKFY